MFAYQVDWQTPARTSSLSAPTLQLTGHGAAVLANRFNGDGSVLATGSFDKKICRPQIVSAIVYVEFLIGVLYLSTISSMGDAWRLQQFRRPDRASGRRPRPMLFRANFRTHLLVRIRQSRRRLGRRHSHAREEVPRSFRNRQCMRIVAR